MTDAYTSELAFACAFELKEPNGGHSEAEAQLATLHTAMLLKLEDLAQDTGAILQAPALVGWVVVGHNWFCYISTLCPDGSIVRIIDKLYCIVYSLVATGGPRPVQ